MDLVANAAGKWTLSARPTGEVLIARRDDGEISLAAFGSPSGASIATQPDFLRDLLRAARENVQRDPAPGPIPALLHHVLVRLLALESGSWGALAVYDDGVTSAVGAVGALDVQAALGGHPARLPWVRLRDRSGREATAFKFRGDRDVRLGAHGIPGEGGALSGVTIEATWIQGARQPAVPLRDPAAGTNQSDAAPAASNGFFQWLDRMVGQQDGNAPATNAAPTAPAASSASVPPVTFVSDSTAALAPSHAPPTTAHRPTEPPLEIIRGAELVGPPQPRHGDLLPDARVIPITPVMAREQIESGSRVEEWNESAWRAASGAGHTVAMGSAQSASAFGHEVEDAREPAVPPGHESEPGSRPGLAAESTPPAVKPRALKLAPPPSPNWPGLLESDHVPIWRRPWAWVVLVAALVGGAALMNTVGGRGRSGFGLSSFGPHFSLTVNSRPAGAWIAIDGKDTGRLTPATLDLPTGAHRVTLTLTGKGAATYVVNGARDSHTAVDAAMYGAVAIAVADPGVPVSVTLDGLDRGYAPVSVEDLLPGPHEIRFRSPGADPWSETFDLAVGEKHEVVARPFESPRTGMIDVKATIQGPDGVEPLKGAQIFVDAEPRGVTPATLELPRGPHSIRVVNHGEEMPVQVIDLPGGNHRISEFAFGTDGAPAHFVQLGTSGAIAANQPTVVSTAITGVGENDLREMWLHVRAPEGGWRRYEMTLLHAPDGIVGVAVFPAAMLDANGTSTYYASALTQEGDEYFTELHAPRDRGAAEPPRARRAVIKPAALPTPSADPSTP
jgi:PEGA domain-containing protein